MKKLIFCAAVAAAFAVGGCKHVEVTAPDWSASYTSLFQSNDVQGLSVKAGEAVQLKLEKANSGVAPEVAEALKSAANALNAAAGVCSGGVCGE